MYIPPMPKAPGTCGKCENCKRGDGYQGCKHYSINNIKESEVARAFSKKRIQTPPPATPPRVVVNHKTQEQKLEESTIRYGMKRNFQLGVLVGAGATVVGYYLGHFLFSIGI